DLEQVRGVDVAGSDREHQGCDDPGPPAEDVAYEEVDRGDAAERGHVDDDAAEDQDVAVADVPDPEWRDELLEDPRLVEHRRPPRQPGRIEERERDLLDGPDCAA